MKNSSLILIISLLSYNLYSQSQAETFVTEAQTFLAAKDYRNAILSLQDAINDLNNLVAAQIAESLPSEINGLRADDAGTVNTAAMGFLGGGMQIVKSYRNPSKPENEAEVQIISNSPLMTSMSMFLNNPAMMGQGAKSCRIGSRRAIMKTEMQDHYDDNGASKQIRVTEIQIPLTQTLITINARGFASEADEMAFATKLDVEKLRTALGE